MYDAENELAELASINLEYAQAEIALAGDRESISRALDHIRQAKAYLTIRLAEFDGPLEVDDPEPGEDFDDLESNEKAA